MALRVRFGMSHTEICRTKQIHVLQEDPSVSLTHSITWSTGGNNLQNLDREAVAELGGHGDQDYSTNRHACPISILHPTPEVQSGPTSPVARGGITGILIAVSLVYQERGLVGSAEPLREGI